MKSPDRFERLLLHLKEQTPNSDCKKLIDVYLEDTNEERTYSYLAERTNMSLIEIKKNEIELLQLVKDNIDYVADLISEKERENEL